MGMAMNPANDGTAGPQVIEIVDVEDKDWAHVTQCQQVGQGNCAAAAPVGGTVIMNIGNECIDIQDGEIILQARIDEIEAKIIETHRLMEEGRQVFKHIIKTSTKSHNGMLNRHPTISWVAKRLKYGTLYVKIGMPSHWLSHCHQLSQWRS